MFPLETKILIVDDIKSLRDLLKAYLRRLGYTDIGEAEDGTDAWKEILQAADLRKPYQLVISDWNMPQMSGVELLKKIRSHPSTKELSFILLTTESEKARVLEAVHSGVSNYMVKPVTEDVLKDKMRNVHSKSQKPSDS